MKILPIVFTILLSFISILSKAQYAPDSLPGIHAVSFYICAHQDDWQLFMGSNVFNDINDYKEKEATGRKVVLIYVTAGNLHDNNDSGTCNCKDPNNKPMPYWMVREHGSKNSLHLAACRVGGWGSCTPYPRTSTVTINGHKLARYEYKNTVSYYMRLRIYEYGVWAFDQNKAVNAIDMSARYSNQEDFIKTLCNIYRAETDECMPTEKITFNFQDHDEQENPNDHPHHYQAGKLAHNAARMLAGERSVCYKERLFMGYNNNKLPPNLPVTDVQNATALIATYCTALLDYNAWPEWDNGYREWVMRSYYRHRNICDE